MNREAPDLSSHCPYKIPIHSAPPDQSESRIGFLIVQRNEVAGGHIWRTKFDVPSDFRESPGVYEWRIYSPKPEKIELAGYFGVATRFVDRIPMYWRDMAAQLIDLHSGSTSLTGSHTPKYEKARLRWIHFWLAWAYVQRAPVELVIHRFPNRSLDDEINFIQSAMASGRHLVNKEAQGKGKIYVNDVRKIFSRRDNKEDTSVVRPPDWDVNSDICPNAQPWLEAIDLWERKWRLGRPKLGES